VVHNFNNILVVKKAGLRHILNCSCKSIEVLGAQFIKRYFLEIFVYVFLFKIKFFPRTRKNVFSDPRFDTISNVNLPTFIYVVQFEN